MTTGWSSTPANRLWVPVDAHAGSHGRETTLTFDNHRRLEDRVYRSARYAGRVPIADRAAHHDVEVFATGTRRRAHAALNLSSAKFWDKETRTLATGWAGLIMSCEKCRLEDWQPTGESRSMRYQAIRNPETSFIAAPLTCSSSLAEIQRSCCARTAKGRLPVRTRLPRDVGSISADPSMTDIKRTCARSVTGQQRLTAAQRIRSLIRSPRAVAHTADEQRLALKQS